MKDGFHSGAVAPPAGEITKRCRKPEEIVEQLGWQDVCVLVSVRRMRMSAFSGMVEGCATWSTSLRKLFKKPEPAGLCCNLSI